MEFYENIELASEVKDDEESRDEFEALLKANKEDQA